MIKKYDLYIIERCIPYRKRYELKTGCGFPDGGDIFNTLIKRYDSLSEARKEFEKYKTTVAEFSGKCGKFYEVTEYYIEECTYYEDEFDEEDPEGLNTMPDKCNIIDMTEMKIEVWVGTKLVEIFDNYEGAEWYMEDCNEKLQEKYDELEELGEEYSEDWASIML